MSKVVSKQNIKDAIYENNLRIKTWFLSLFPNQFLDTKTIDFTHDVDNRTLKADVKISAFVDAQHRPNAIVEKDDGIYAPDYSGDLTALDQKIDDTYQQLDTEIKKLPDTFVDSQTVDFTQDIPNRKVTAEVKIVNSGENALEIRENGLFVDKYFDLDVDAIIEAVWDNFTPDGYQYMETSDGEFIVDADNNVFLVLDPSE